MFQLTSILDKVQCAEAFDFMSKLPAETIDLVICDGPYGVTEHQWDDVNDIQAFNLRLICEFSRLLKPGGALYLFGKPDCIDFIDYRPYLKLNARIVWYQPSRLAQGRRNFTNNHDVICFFSKGPARRFNLDDIRVPQLVELEHRRRCEKVPSVKNGKYGKTKFNELGKNPGDVWGDIKQLTYKSKELVARDLLNTIQKPERLIERIVRASSNPQDIVLDVFAGSGTVPVVCSRLQRHFVACEINPHHVGIAVERLASATNAQPLFSRSSRQESQIADVQGLFL